MFKRTHLLIATSLLFLMIGSLTLNAQEKVNINSATAEQLLEIPGVGESTAASIIEKRKELGGFKALDDLLQVKGIGEKKLEKMKPFLTL
ncbi:MAG: ComEA family DNA-binding protein [Thermodesulfobacteriota bacterium]